MSPEQVHGEEPGSSSDLFAAAVISAELFLPRRLMDEGSPGKTLHQLRGYDLQALDLESLPSAVAGVIRKGLSTARENRYRDAGEFSRAICTAVPVSAGRSELESFWDVLFPIGDDEEDTVVSEHLPGEREDIVRESRQRYGKQRGRLMKIGALAVLAALSIVGWAAWKEATPPSSSSALLPDGTGAISKDSRRFPEVVPPDGDPGRSLPGSEKGSAVTPLRSASDLEQDSPSKTVLIETDPAGVFVLLDDRTPLGRTPMHLDVAPWQGRKILLHLEGYAAKGVSVDVLSRHKTFRLEMERQLGTIEVIQAIPWAKVYDGDQYVGISPIRNWKLPVGPHRFRFVNEPLGVEIFQDVTIHPGNNPRLIVPLVEKQP
jgi:hypothetical protein